MAVLFRSWRGSVLTKHHPGGEQRETLLLKIRGPNRSMLHSAAWYRLVPPGWQAFAAHFDRQI